MLPDCLPPPDPSDPPADTTHDQAPSEEEIRSSRALFAAAVVVLVPVAVIGAALSFRSLYLAAAPVYGTRMALGFPLLVDFLILGASLVYVSGAKVGHPRAGWRITAHAGVVTTLGLNAYASVDRPQDIPWHVVAPAVWSVLVELTSREMLGRWRAVHQRPTDRIPVRLWLTAPGESIRTSWRMARTGERSAAVARIDADRCAAARDALARVLPGPRQRRVRRQITRRLWAGSIDPGDVLAAIGWLTTDHDIVDRPDPDYVLRMALRAVMPGQVDRPALTGPGQWTEPEVGPLDQPMAHVVGHVVDRSMDHTDQPVTGHETVAHQQAPPAAPTVASDVNPQVEPQDTNTRPVARRPVSVATAGSQDAVLAVMEPGIEYGMGEIVMATGRPRSTVKRAVSDLIASGRVESFGDPARPKYRLGGHAVDQAVKVAQ